MKNIVCIIWLVCCLSITGCWDKVELESRGFVVSLGIDGYEASEKEQSEQNKNDEQSRFNISISLPNVTAIASPGGGGEENKTVKSAVGRTVSSAMGKIDSLSSQKLFYGQTRVAVLGKDIIEDEQLFREAIDALQRNLEISKKIIILATDEKALDILNMKPANEPLTGIYISNFYENTKDTVLLLDLEKLTERLSYSGCAIIPRVQLENDELKVGGAAVVKDLRLSGWLTEEESRSYLWITGKGKGMHIPTEQDNAYTTLKVNGSKSKLSFFEENEQILCRADISIEGNLEEYHFLQNALDDDKREAELSEIEKAYEELISKEIVNTFNILQNEYKADGFELSDKIRKFNYDIYKKYEKDEILDKIILEAKVTVKIHGTGSVM